ncbi:MAG: prepilin-type N-terminal cleavage/methylation domain-containing protein [Phycisphaerales bacterium]|nr:prepilin-type N-terminal cleavage/methylation domain-containing protein [Phycisphaerales bacterium]
MRNRTRHRASRARHGFTLIELILATGITTLLVGGLASAILLATRSIDTGVSPVADTRSANDTLDWIETDLAFATTAETSPHELALTVPDRNDADLLPETIVYRWSGIPGDPLLRRYNADPEVTIASAVTDLEFFPPTRTTEPSQVPPALDPSSWGYFGGDDGILNAAVLMVITDAASPSLQSVQRQSMLESWSAVVTLISANATKASFDAAIPAADVVYITQECDELEIGNKLRDAPIGVVSEPTRLHDEQGFATTADTRSQAAVSIIDTTHDITAGMATGNMTVQDAARKLTRLQDDLAVSLVTLGEVSGDPALALLESGGIREDSTTSPSRRVNLPFGGSDFDFDLLNANGLALVRRSLEWASERVISKQFGHTDIYTTAATNVEKTQVGTLANLPEDGIVSSISAYVDPAGKKMRLAVYDDTGGEPGTLLVESEVVQLSGLGWKTLPIKPTLLPAGDYWLALVFERNNQFYYHGAPGELRYADHNALDGFRETWGMPSDSFNVSASIHATYTPN